MLRVRDTMEIEDADGHSVATVKKAMITPLRERWTVKVANGPDLQVQGNILDHEYAVEDGRTTAAEVSKKWFRVADTYGVEVAPGQDPVLLLAITAVLDKPAHASGADPLGREQRQDDALARRWCGRGFVLAPSRCLPGSRGWR